MILKIVVSPVYLTNYEFLCREADTNALLDRTAYELFGVLILEILWFEEPDESRNSCPVLGGAEGEIPSVYLPLKNGMFFCS